MDIVVFSDDFYPSTNGGALEQWEFCKGSSRHGHNVTVFTYKREGQKSEEEERGVKIYRPVPAEIKAVANNGILSLILRSIFSVGLLIFSIYKLYGTNKDVVYCAPYTTYITGKTVAMLFDLPYVSFVSNSPSQGSDPPGKIKSVLEHILFSYLLSDDILCRTSTIKNVLKHKYNKKAKIVHGFLSEDDIKRAICQDNVSLVDQVNEGDDVVLINVGRAVPIKNQVGAIRVMNGLPENYQLIIVGDGPSLPKLNRTVAELGLEDRVTLVGEVEHDATLQLILASDALLHTSTTESGPIVLFEALALGSLAFSTPVGRAPNLDSDRVYCGTEDQLIDYIKTKNVRNRSEYTVQTDVLDRYSMERYTQEVLDFLYDIVQA